MWLTFYWLPIQPLPDMLVIRGANGCKLVWTTRARKSCNFNHIAVDIKPLVPTKTK